MSWLVGSTLASLVGAIIVVRALDALFAGVTHTAVHTARAGLFVGTWMAITASSWNSHFTKFVGRLRNVPRVVSEQIAPTKKGK